MASPPNLLFLRTIFEWTEPFKVCIYEENPLAAQSCRSCSGIHLIPLHRYCDFTFRVMCIILAISVLFFFPMASLGEAYASLPGMGYSSLCFLVG